MKEKLLMPSKYVHIKFRLWSFLMCSSREWHLLYRVTKHICFSLCFLNQEYASILSFSPFHNSLPKKQNKTKLINMYNCTIYNNFNSLQMCFGFPGWPSTETWFFGRALTYAALCKLHFSLHRHEQHQRL